MNKLALKTDYCKAPTQAAIRLKLTEDEAGTSTVGESAWLSDGLAIEDAQ